MAYKIFEVGSNRYIGNARTRECHDELNKRNSCQIDEIFVAGNAVGFAPDTFSQAQSEGFDGCAHCLPGSSRR